MLVDELLSIPATRYILQSFHIIYTAISTGKFIDILRYRLYEFAFLGVCHAIKELSKGSISGSRTLLFHFYACNLALLIGLHLEYLGIESCGPKGYGSSFRIHFTRVQQCP